MYNVRQCHADDGNKLGKVFRIYYKFINFAQFHFYISEYNSLINWFDNIPCIKFLDNSFQYVRCVIWGHHLPFLWSWNTLRIHRMRGDTSRYQSRVGNLLRSASPLAGRIVIVEALIQMQKSKETVERAANNAV